MEDCEDIVKRKSIKNIEVHGTDNRYEVSTNHKPRLLNFARNGPNLLKLGTYKQALTFIHRKINTSQNLCLTEIYAKLAAWFLIECKIDTNTNLQIRRYRRNLSYIWKIKRY